MQAIKKIIYQLGLTASNISNNKSLLDGSIIGQIGKASLFRTIPRCLTTPLLLQTKTHNYSKVTYKLLKGYVAGLPKNSKISVQDYFAWEIRVGRWGSRSKEVYNLLGVNIINPFNNAELVFLFSQLNRSFRSNYGLHEYLIYKNNPQLLYFNYKNNSGLIEYLIDKGFVYYLASLAKFFGVGIKRYLKR